MCQLLLGTGIPQTNECFTDSAGQIHKQTHESSRQQVTRASEDVGTQTVGAT